MKNRVVVAMWVSLIAVPSIAQDHGSVGPRFAQLSLHEKPHPKQAVESAIAGLRPGRDTIEKAYRRFHKDRVIKDLSSPDSALWMDDCNHQTLTVAFDTKGIIREVRIEPAPVSTADCSPGSYSRSVRARMGSTRRGLVFRDSCDRIQQIYGTPQSQGRSAHGDQQFVYRFDQGDKPSVLTLELTCNHVRNDVEAIKLTISDAAKP